MKSRFSAIALAIGVLFSTPAAFGEDAKTQQSPKDAYLNLHKKELEAKSYEDLLKIRSSRSIKKDQPMSKEETAVFFELFKTLTPTKVEIVKVQTSGDEATLQVIAPSDDPKDKTTGTITLVLEDGEWKLDREKWKSNSGDVD